FICTFDLYGLNEPVYFFENFDQKNGLKFGDNTYKIIVNTKSTKKNIPKELKALFQYINENEIDEGDDLICGLDKEVSRLNREDDEWRRQAMRLDEEIELRAEFSKREGIEQGLKEGIEQGESIFAALTKKLMDDSRMDDLMRATTDEQFREALYHEYKLKKPLA
ncbi:MAG: hypothetical protein Q4C25_08150, partial [Bacillota bacterium]|nr:hypothetical protein [Bacillota bacterium]